MKQKSLWVFALLFACCTCLVFSSCSIDDNEVPVNPPSPPSDDPIDPVKCTAKVDFGDISGLPADLQAAMKKRFPNLTSDGDADICFCQTSEVEKFTKRLEIGSTTIVVTTEITPYNQNMWNPYSDDCDTFDWDTFHMIGYWFNHMQTAIKLVDKDGNEPSGLVYNTTPIPENATDSHQYTQGTSTTIGGSVNGGFIAGDREPGLAAAGSKAQQLGPLFHQERIYGCRDGKHQILQDG